MTRPHRPLDPAELSGFEPEAGAGDTAEAMLAARALEASIATGDPVISADLADRIMASVRREPPPRGIGILASLRRRPGPAGLVDSLGLAWARVVTTGSVAVRATALAYVALVLVIGVSLTGVAAYAAAGALGLLSLPSRGPDATQLVTSPQPVQSPTPTEVESPEPSDSAEPTETAEPTESAGGEHQDGGSGEEATPTPGDGEDGGRDSGSSTGSDG